MCSDDHVHAETNTWKHWKNTEVDTHTYRHTIKQGKKHTLIDVKRERIRLNHKKRGSNEHRNKQKQKNIQKTNTLIKLRATCEKERQIKE